MGVHIFEGCEVRLVHDSCRVLKVQLRLRFQMNSSEVFKHFKGVLVSTAAFFQAHLSGMMAFGLSRSFRTKGEPSRTFA